MAQFTPEFLDDLRARLPVSAVLELLGLPDADRSTEKKLWFERYYFDLEKSRIYDLEEERAVELPAFVMREKGLSEDDALEWIDEHTPMAPGAATIGANGHHEDARPDLPEILADERALIGLILLKPDVLKFAEEEVAASDFISPLHAAVFGLFLDAREQEYRADIKTLIAALGGEGHRAPAGYTIPTYVARLAASAPFMGDDAADEVARALARQIRDTAEVERGREPEPESTAPSPEERPLSPKPPRFRMVHFGDIKVSARPRYLVRGLIPLTGVVVIWGPPKCGKSFWTSDLLFHVALGWSYRNRKVEQGAVVYVILEGETGFSDRIEAFRQRFLADRVEPVPFYVISQKLNLVADHLQLIADIRAQLPADVNPAVVAIDTLNRSLQGSESSDQDMGNYVKAADAVRTAFNCVVPIVHHCGIESARPRGHSSLTGAADAQISIRRDPAKNVVTSVEYMKDGPEGDTLVSKLQVVTVGKEPDGHPITSCVVVALGDNEALQQKVAAQGFVLRPTEEPIFRALLAALRKAPVAPSEEMVALGVPADRMAVHYRDWREAYKVEGVAGGEAGEAPDDDAIRKRFDRYSRFMISSGVIVWKRPWLTWTGKVIRGFAETRPKPSEDRTNSGQWSDEAMNQAGFFPDQERTEAGHTSDSADLEELFGTGQ